MILENIVLVIGLIGLGSLCRRSSLFPKNSAEVLNVFILNISLPAIILISIPKLVINSNILIPVFSHWTAFIIHGLLLIIAKKIFSFKNSVFGALFIVTILGNTAFLGIPIVNSFLGEQGVPFAVLYDQLGSGFGFIFMAAFILPKYVGKEVGSLKNIAKKLLKFPPFIALVLGFVFIYLPVPAVVNKYLESIANTLIPCAMIAVGFQMKYKLPKTTVLPLAVGLCIKLIILPLIMFSLMGGIVEPFFYFNIAEKASILQSGMPPMITAGALVMNEGLEEDLCASLVGYGLIVSFVSLSFLNLLL